VHNCTWVGAHDHWNRIQASQKLRFKKLLTNVDRPGTNWTSWFTYLIAGVMQGALLVLCIAWKYRQRRLGIDDFGNGQLVEHTHLIRK